jgi:hypothetical protein
MSRHIAAIAGVAMGFMLMGATGSGPIDADSRAWWSLTTVLSADDMEGRDTGSDGLERAARLVAERLAAAGLKPLGDDGTWFQRIDFEEVGVPSATLRGSGGKLAFLDEFTVSPNSALPAVLDAPIAYRGYCAADALGDVVGKLVICHGTRREGLPSGAERELAVRAAGGLGVATIVDPGFSIEPPRWPFAYARSVYRKGNLPAPDPFVKLSINADALGKLLGRNTTRLVAEGSAGRPLPDFDSGRAELGLTIRTAQYSSPNVIGLLPGTNPALADQAIVLGAHLDGYGFGRGVNGDVLYNGTLDNAAYVALIVHLMEKQDRKGYARPVIVAFWTGEEKGLHGSKWFIEHPTIPLKQIAANINLDQLRPIFPLDLMTVHGRTDTTLGSDASAIATSQDIRVQDDPEPERNLLRRSDHWLFLEAGIPAVNFVFGYDPGSRSEEIYRQWYRTGYHRPQDDLVQMIDWQAAADFNRFFYALVDRVANKPEAPTWHDDSKLRPASGPSVN